MAETQDREAVERAYRGWCEARKGAPLVPGEFEATRSRVEEAWMSAALSAAGWDGLVAERDRLRAGIEAFGQDTTLYADLEAACMAERNPSTLADKVQDIMADRLRALLAETGQPGEGWRCPATGPHEAHEWRITSEASRHCAGRPAPVVPDSADVRDDDWWAIRAMAVDLAVDVEAIDAEWAEVSVVEQERYRALGRLARGVLAITGQGATAEQVEKEFRWVLAQDHGHTVEPHCRTCTRRIGRLIEAMGEIGIVVVRSGEQGGEGL